MNRKNRLDQKEKKSITKKPLKQHFVPQFYLKNFGEQLHVFDKTTGNKFKTTPKHIAYQKNFYGYEIEGMSFEKILSRFEAKHAKSIQILISKKNYYLLNDVDKKNICDFLAMLFLRTEVTKNQTREITNGVLNEICNQAGIKDWKISCNEEYVTISQIRSILSYECYSEIISCMKFVILENNTRTPFWTSDNPISKENELDNTPFGNLGFTNSGIEHYLPLTPKLTLAFIDPIHFAEMPNYAKSEPENVLRHNFLQLDTSNRFVFSNIKKFPRAKEMLNTNPHYRVVDRPRFKLARQDTSIETNIYSMDRNHRFPIKSNKPIMTKLNTWMPIDQAEELKKKHSRLGLR